MKICLLVHKIKPYGPVNAFKRVKKALETIGCTVHLMEISDYIATDQSFDICISTGIRPDFVNRILWKSKIKFYYKVNDPFEDYPLAFGVKGYLYALAHALLFSIHARAVLCCSQSVSKTLFIKHPLLYFPQDFNVRAKKVNVGKVNREKKIILASPFSKRKRDFDLLKAIVDNGLDKRYKVIVIGDGPEKSRCVSAFGHSDILFYPFSDTLEAFFGSGDIYCSASSSEGLPTIAMIASINGAICLLSNISAHQELNVLAENVILFDSLSEVPYLLDKLLNSDYIQFQQTKLAESMSAEFFVQEFQRILNDVGN